MTSNAGARVGVPRAVRESGLRRATVFPEAEIVAAVRRQLMWAHVKLLVPSNDTRRREFYAETCRVEGSSTRMLRSSSPGFEVTACDLKLSECASVQKLSC